LPLGSTKREKEGGREIKKITVPSGRQCDKHKETKEREKSKGNTLGKHLKRL